MIVFKSGTLSKIFTKNLSKLRTEVEYFGFYSFCFNKKQFARATDYRSYFREMSLVLIFLSPNCFPAFFSPTSFAIVSSWKNLQIS